MSPRQSNIMTETDLFQSTGGFLTLWPVLAQSPVVTAPEWRLDPVPTPHRQTGETTAVDQQLGLSPAPQVLHVQVRPFPLVYPIETG